MLQRVSTCRSQWWEATMGRSHSCTLATIRDSGVQAPLGGAGYEQKGCMLLCFEDDNTLSSTKRMLPSKNRGLGHFALHAWHLECMHSSVVNDGFKACALIQQ